MAWRLGIDIGGTFNHVAIVNEATGENRELAQMGVG